MIKSSLIKKSYLLLTVLSVFALSIMIEPYYIYGDQVHYHRVYNGLNGFNIADAYIFYKANIDSREPGYFFLAWASSNLSIEKNYFITFFNVILSFFAYKYLIKKGGHPFIVFVIISFGYYSCVLFFAAERLKFSFIFLLIGLVYSKKSSIFYILSVITHSQMVIVFISAFMLKIKTDILRLFTKLIVTKRFLLLLIGVSSISVVVFISMQEHFLSKFDSYFELRNIVELSKLFSFFALSYLYAKNRSDVVIFFIPLFFFTLIFGGERVNFIGYFAFLYFSIYYKKGFNFGVLLTTVYFLYAGFDFVLNILKYGSGYYGT